ncbi:hypothetical protein IF1G_00793 [Cordyceps javanica]|uniref:Uncharacterized protein n=1 Tax=Cordyceps javanica TaxID=43265 RepID=A0A545VGM2_9HYPO|nr:hypothetical protein IF1G_00793 [Cordyceps javanica]TQW12039.1 hypothetical protein IF2G_00770 [Cordyceps javanica]
MFSSDPGGRSSSGHGPCLDTSGQVARDNPKQKLHGLRSMASYPRLDCSQGKLRMGHAIGQICLQPK